VVVVPVVETANEFTKALVLGPKYPDAGEIPFAAWYLAKAAFVKAPK
jgi:hypothetical protein